MDVTFPAPDVTAEQNLGKFKQPLPRLLVGLRIGETRYLALWRQGDLKKHEKAYDLMYSLF